MTNDTKGEGTRPKLSVVIPAYNEEKTLAGHFDVLVPVLNGVLGTDWEVIVFDDGSIDRTAEVVREYGHERIRVLSHQPNQGKGAAVKAGILASRGDAVLLCDADMATPPVTLLPFLDALSNGAEIVIGNRKDPRSSIARKQPPLRRFLGNGFIWLSSFLTSTSVADFNCGFKLFRGDIARALMTETTAPGWAYDIEILALATRHGYKIVELPVSWSHGVNSCVRLPGDLFKTLREMIRIWVRLHRTAGRL